MARFTTVVAVVVVASAYMGSAQSTPHAVSTTAVFTAGEGGYDAFRIPGIAAYRGVILVFAEGRKYGCGDFAGQHNIVFKRSTDGGATFGPLSVLADPGQLWPSQCPLKYAPSETMSCEFWDPTPVIDRHTGQIMVMATRSWPHNNLTTVSSRMDAEMDCWLWKSSDLGLTWTAPQNITSMIWSERWRVGTPVNGHAIQTATGRLLMPIYVRAGTDASSYSGTFYSDDHGDTWTFANASMVGPGTSESDVVQLQHTPGTLMFNHRGNSASGPGHVRYTSYSTDDGLTWHGFAPAPELPDPGCKGGIAAWPAAKALLFTNAATTKGRVNITLRLSVDDGKTWPTKLLISEPGGYSDVVVLENTSSAGADTACVVFEADTCSIRLAVVDPRRLLPPTSPVASRPSNSQNSPEA